MYKKLFFLVILSWITIGCSSSKKVISNTKNSFTKADKIVENALQYNGVKYQYGGVTNNGMDCSGIVFVAFGSQKVQLPRVSSDMANRGRKTSLNKVIKGDLLFFRTNKSTRSINHVGLIVSVENRQIKFIHATVSKGVIVSDLSENYWKNAFVKAVKIL